MKTAALRKADSVRKTAILLTAIISGFHSTHGISAVEISDGFAPPQSHYAAVKAAFRDENLQPQEGNSSLKNTSIDWLMNSSTSVLSHPEELVSPNSQNNLQTISVTAWSVTLKDHKPLDIYLLKAGQTKWSAVVIHTKQETSRNKITAVFEMIGARQESSGKSSSEIVSGEPKTPYYKISSWAGLLSNLQETISSSSSGESLFIAVSNEKSLSEYFEYTADQREEAEIGSLVMPKTARNGNLLHEENENLWPDENADAETAELMRILFSGDSDQDFHILYASQGKVITTSLEPERRESPEEPKLRISLVSIVSRLQARWLSKNSPTLEEYLKYGRISRKELAGIRG